MECNKDEAVRAKEIAEEKMENKDFVGARKVLLRGQQLHPGLENICQMLTVCEIHCSAEQQVMGSEKDWYGILQVERTADEVSIKKQYRKLALLLHPDKNKFAGAEAAFKLIGEAHTVLTDQIKRSAYDMKFRTFAGASVPEQFPMASSTSSFSKQMGVQNTFTNFGSPSFKSFKPNPQPQPTGPRFSRGRQTIWSICPTCGTRYQTYNDASGADLCPYCKLVYGTHNLDSQYRPQETYYYHPTFSQYNVFPFQIDPKVNPQYTYANNFHSWGFYGNCSTGDEAAKSFPNTQSNCDVGMESTTKEKEQEDVDTGLGKKIEDIPNFMAEKSREGSPSEKTNKKRARTYPNTQSHSNVGIGSKNNGKEVGNGGTETGTKSEREHRLMAENTKDGNRICESKFQNTQSNSNTGIRSKHKGKEDGKFDMGMRRRAEKLTPKFVAERSRERKYAEDTNEKGERTNTNRERKYADDTNEKGERTNLNRQSSSNVGIGSNTRGRVDKNVDKGMERRTDKLPQFKGEKSRYSKLSPRSR